ncbi:MAG: aspartyl-tRNA(Asn)/glutamyl-tRNA(Gln) amidotransferase subunit B [Chloroflexi bacterium]|jgi:aspartyl-tRNA(Asn)/glutamyl-tRNA(Gln) amidotransferase subunit B|nr:MAG: aspartyl-tRNA(Asn)/glutamyl-tRNA(Gln) amidotransferase subunit B [Chloroflexota bacterium]|tara:strand:+ start:5542 stop:7029 length:1488 start_codon:yes stop_codon:yes gene_type:complete
MKKLEAVIGLEIHVQLSTQSKMFCGCPRNYFNEPPNTKVCPVCLGMPGMLPVINKKAVELTILTGLALESKINHLSIFARKNYHYPDLVKGYQISQFEEPLCDGGMVTFLLGMNTINVQLERIHLEEDTARLIHNNIIYKDGSLMDVNRSGVPLMEIVSKPDIYSADAAVGYLKKIRQIVRYIGVSEADMEKGSFRCDANISIREKGDSTLGNKVEVKNMNSFKSVHKAIETEIERQTVLFYAGDTIVQETRGFIDGKGITVSQRSKEQAQDYRYFPEPDLPPLLISKDAINELKNTLVELPNQKSNRFQNEYNLNIEESEFLVTTQQTANNFEISLTLACKLIDNPDIEVLAKNIANWYMGDIAKELNQISLAAELQNSKVTPENISELIYMIQVKQITVSTAKSVLEKMFSSGKNPKLIVKTEGLGQVNDSVFILELIERILTNNQKAVNDYLNGKETVIGFLVGQVMKETKGRIDANEAAKLLIKKISENAK